MIPNREPGLSIDSCQILFSILVPRDSPGPILEISLSRFLGSAKETAARRNPGEVRLLSVYTGISEHHDPYSPPDARFLGNRDREDEFHRRPSRETPDHENTETP